MKGIVPGGSSEELDCLGTVLALGLAPPEAGLAEAEDRAAVGTFLWRSRELQRVQLIPL